MDLLHIAHLSSMHSDRLREVERLNGQGFAAGRGAPRPARAARTTFPERFRARLDRSRGL